MAKRLLTNVVGVLVLLGGASVSHAAPILTLDDGMGNTATVQDTDGDGIVSFFGSLGSFLINVTTGLSYPAIGGPNEAKLDLASLNVSGGTGTLVITLADTFSPIPWTSAALTSAIGGVTTGDVAFETHLNGSLMESFNFPGRSPGQSFSETSRTSLTGQTSNPFDLAIMAAVTHGPRGGITSFNGAAIVHTPEPMALTLLGGGLALAAVRQRRRRMKKDRPV